MEEIIRFQEPLRQSILVSVSQHRLQFIVIRLQAIWPVVMPKMSSRQALVPLELGQGDLW